MFTRRDISCLASVDQGEFLLASPALYALFGSDHIFGFFEIFMPDQSNGSARSGITIREMGAFMLRQTLLKV